MKYLYIVLIGALLIGCGASDDDGDKGNLGGSTSTGSNTPSSSSATKGGSTSTTPKTKDDNTPAPSTKGDVAPSTTYIEGDFVFILKNASKTEAKDYSSKRGTEAKEKGLKFLPKGLGLESCVSLGFVYKETVNESDATVKKFTKGDTTCSERTITDSTKTGTFNSLFLFRK